MAQGSEEPPFLRVGTEVSAKYRGAFCEASIKTIKKHVKCKIQYKDNTTATLTDDVVKGDLKVGSTVEVKTLDGRLMDGVIVKLTDASTYTVVFDDGDERTLRRSSLCLKGGRHFNESETLDHLPLTDPENFGTPVMQNGKKRKKRRPSTQLSSFDDSDKEESSPVPSKKKCLYNDSIVGKVVVVERGARRKSHWFPALGVSPSQENLVHIKSKDHCLARSFKDGNYHVISIKDTKEFSKDQEPVSSSLKSDSRNNKPAVERAVAYLETGRVPATWEGSKSEVITYDETDDETSKKHTLRLTKAASSDDDNDECDDDDAKREAFAEKLQIFMEKQGTPIVRNPVLGNQDLDLRKLYLFVTDAGGMDEVTKKQEWRNIYSKMGIAIMPPSASHHIKMAYKKYLHPYELHELTCGTSKDNSDDDKSDDVSKRDRSSHGRTRHERNSKSLSRAAEKPEKPDKPVDKRAKPVSTDVAEKSNNSKPAPAPSNKPRRTSTSSKPTAKQSVASPKQSVASPTSNKPTSKPALPVSPPSKPNKLSLPSTFSSPPSKQVTTPTGKASKSLSKQSSKSSTPDSSKELLEDVDHVYVKVETDSECKNGAEVKTVVKQEDEHIDEQRSYKREDSLESDVDVDEEVTSPDSELAVDVVNSPGCMSDTSESKSDTRSDFGTDEPLECIVGDKIQVKYGRGRNRRLYEAKIVTVDPDAEEGLLYQIHYTGWNMRYDEWISPDRILGKSSKLSKKKGFGVKEFQKSKLPPKPIGKQFVRSQSKRGTKSPSPASPGDNSNPSDTKPPHTNGNKPSPRSSPPLQQIDSPTSANPAAKNGTCTRRTRSDRNSFSSNGTDEAVKSPPSKRRQKSLTPEPPEDDNTTDKSKENPTTASVEEARENHEDYNETTELLIKTENVQIESPDEDVGSGDLPHHIKVEPKSNELVKSNARNNLTSKLKNWSKLPNGLISYSSSESGSPEHSASENDVEPASKKMKVGKDKEIGKEEIENLLNTDVEGKAPISAPHSEGSCSSDDQHVSVCPDQDDRQMNSAPVDSEQNADSEGKGETRSNSSGPDSSKEEKATNQEDDKSEKKDSDIHGKQPRKRKERKRHRHHSVNENSNDGCSSNAANSPSSKGSPTRPKISFSADLESIKSMEDGSERVRLLQLKINEMRKIYGSLKAEVASIDRKRKKLRKKREENSASSAHDSKSTSNCVPSSPTTLECR